MRKSIVRRIPVRRVVIVVIRIAVRSWRAVLFVGRVDSFGLVDGRWSWRVDCDAAGWHLRLWLTWMNRVRDILHVIFVDCSGVLWWRFLDREWWIPVAVDRRRLVRIVVGRGRLTWVVATATFIALSFVEHRGALWRISLGEWMWTVLGNLVSVGSHRCCDLRLGLWHDVVGQMHIVEGVQPAWVLNANHLVVVHLWQHLVVDSARFSDVTLSVSRSGRNCTRSRLRDEVLIVVDRRRRDGPAGFSIQTIIGVSDIAMLLGWRLNCPRLIRRRALMTNGSTIRRVKVQFARHRIFVRVCRRCLDDLRARLTAWLEGIWKDKQKQLQFAFNLSSSRSDMSTTRERERFIARRNTHSRPESMPILLEELRLSAKRMREGKKYVKRQAGQIFLALESRRQELE